MIHCTDKILIQELVSKNARQHAKASIFLKKIYIFWEDNNDGRQKKYIFNNVSYKNVISSYIPVKHL